MIILKTLLKKLGILLSPLFIVSFLIIAIDPYFNFHNPINGISYIMDNERYQNPGILKRYSYNALITGTSMDENIRVSQVNKLFGVNSVKAPFAGAYFPELAVAMRRAFSTGHNLKMITMSIGYYQYNEDKDYWGNEGFDYPEYMYDDNVFNDGPYLFNVGALKHVFMDLHNTIKGIPSTSIEDYCIWGHNEYGKEAILRYYNRPEKGVEIQFSKKDREVIGANITENIISLAKEHKDTTFYLYFPPYSVIYWDREIRNGGYQHIFDEEKFIIEEFLSVDNIKVFYFPIETDITTNLDNYLDPVHYGEWINSYIVEAMSKGENLLTRENYMEYLNKAKEYYKNYDYDKLFR